MGGQGGYCRARLQFYGKITFLVGKITLSFFSTNSVLTFERKALTKSEYTCHLFLDNLHFLSLLPLPINCPTYTSGPVHVL